MTTDIVVTYGTSLMIWGICRYTKKKQSRQAQNLILLKNIYQAEWEITSGRQMRQIRILNPDS